MSPKGTKKHLSGIEENSDEEGSANVTATHTPRQIALNYDKEVTKAEKPINDNITEQPYEAPSPAFGIQEEDN